MSCSTKVIIIMPTPGGKWSKIISSSDSDDGGDGARSPVCRPVSALWAGHQEQAQEGDDLPEQAIKAIQAATRTGNKKLAKVLAAVAEEADVAEMEV